MAIVNPRWQYKIKAETLRTLLPTVDSWTPQAPAQTTLVRPWLSAAILAGSLFFVNLAPLPPAQLDMWGQPVGQPYAAREYVQPGGWITADSLPIPNPPVVVAAVSEGIFVVL